MALLAILQRWATVAAARRHGWAAAAVIASVSFPAGASSQQATVIRGQVNGPGGVPLPGARVQVTTQRGGRAETLSDSAGRYRVQVPGRDTAFVVSAESAGINPVTRLFVARGRPLEITVDLALLSRAVPLRPVVVRAPRLSVAGATSTIPGSPEQSRSGYELQDEPLGSDDLADLAGREGGAVRVSTGTGTGLAIGGQSPDQTRYTLDGGDAPQGALPREAVREATVLTNAYDVSRGRFTGGQMDVRSQGAGNAWGMSLRLDGQHPALQLGDAPAELRARTGEWRLDGGGGGALVRNRLFAFGAVSLHQVERPGRVLNDAGPARLRALGLDRDSLSRFLDLTRGLRPVRDDAGDGGSSRTSGLLRLDAVLSSRHSLTVRLNGQRSRDRTDGTALAVAGTGTEARSSSLAALATLSSGGNRLANELRFNVTAGTHGWSAADQAPLGVVGVVSGPGAGGGIAMLRFAGDPLGSADSRQHAVELSDQAVWVTGDRAHRVRGGWELGRQEHRSLPFSSPGSFFFRSLDDLENGRPALFARSSGTTREVADVRRAAVFADEHWRTESFGLNVGLRAERLWYGRPGQTGPAVRARFGSEPGVVPSRWLVSPRGGFSFTARMPWDGARGKSEISGGLGDFVGALPLSTLSSALAETGLASRAELLCAGPAAPRPDWAAYRSEPSSIPTACSGGASEFGSRLPAATLFARGFVPPRVRRASLGGQGALPIGVIWRVTGSLIEGVNQPFAIDRNLREAPAFTSADEGGRAIYVAPEAIDPATGAASLVASRRYGELGIVREVGAGGRSRAWQLAVSGTRLVANTWVDAAYTWTRARQTVGPVDAPGGGPASAGGSAFELGWAPSAYAPRHVLRLYVQRPVSRALRLGLTAQLSSGTPFTPMVSGDVNGDGVANDRAYVFDPAGAAGEASVRGEMETLLGGAPGRVRGCLERQLGRIAGQNSCWTGWSPSLDVNAQLRLGPRISGGTHRRVTLWLAAQNVTAGLDYALHGPERLRGWGQFPSVNTTLL